MVVIMYLKHRRQKAEILCQVEYKVISKLQTGSCQEMIGRLLDIASEQERLQNAQSSNVADSFLAAGISMAVCLCSRLALEYAPSSRQALMLAEIFRKPSGTVRFCDKCYLLCKRLEYLLIQSYTERMIQRFFNRQQPSPAGRITELETTGKWGNIY